MISEAKVQELVGNAFPIADNTTKNRIIHEVIAETEQYLHQLVRDKIWAEKRSKILKENQSK